ncbi:replication protein A 14 kDa subunit-like [Zootermopsis nevadensis]|uniref:Replication protein A 14 kDa subunit n=1 Tax=Zootermopsis nevadensis TaxID=136037 RepID=A0A067R9A9_ZOONE|nr:replication protein A 14 kDa subunit-like [Zootermopsis nevadensis]KDR16179.1 Replication protein A 14 kDa subunit [Zootermopsis nevadensis]
MEEQMIEPRVRVNGVALARFMGKPVSIMGTVLNTHASGISVEIKTVDNLVVTVKMQEPLQEPLSGLVEFHGTVQGKNTVSSDFYISLPPEITENFDFEQYNEALTLMNTISNQWVS